MKLAMGIELQMQNAHMAQMSANRKSMEEMALHGYLCAQLVTVEVLYTLLIEVENILNSKTLGYVPWILQILTL
ncbi:unnamed protein product [Merluccius merluccius]